MSVPHYTPAEAREELENRAFFCENENYHAEASAIWEVIDLVEKITERTYVIFSAGDLGTETFLVIP